MSKTFSRCSESADESQAGDSVNGSLPAAFKSPPAIIDPRSAARADRTPQGRDPTACAKAEYLRTAGVLELLPISRRTLCRWMDSGRIKFIRAGSRLILFRRSDIEKMLTRFTVGRAS